MIEIKKSFVLDAYRNASDSEKELLKHLFGDSIFNNVTDRIKTFADAAREVGIEDPEEWEAKYSNLEPGILAYFKLRIITKALNEGWKPKFVSGEYRWTPYFLLRTEEEIGNMSEETRVCVVHHACNNYANSYVGMSYMGAVNDSPNVNTCIGSHLAFKSKELAEYAGKQFIDIYTKFIFK